MHSTPQVSAVIPHYGDSQPTLDLIDSLKNQSYRGDIEIIVSDDNSPVPFPQTAGVQVVRRTENGGFGTNVNTGAREATGQWLLILNSDLEIPATFVEEMVNEAEQLKPALISPQVIGHDGSHQYVARKFPTIFGHAFNWFTPLARFKHTLWWHRAVGHRVGFDSQATVSTDWVIGACMMVPRDVFERVGGFDEGFFMNSEEVDLQRRLKDLRIPSYMVGKIEVTHEGGGSSDDAKRLQWLVDSHRCYAQKWGNEKALVAVLRAVSCANFGFNLLRSIRNRDVKPLKILSQELSYLRG